MDELFHKILFLLPDAKFSIRTSVSESDYTVAQYTKETIYPLNEYFVMWSPLNANAFPGQQAINAVTTAQLQSAQETERKRIRNTAAKSDLSLVANFKVAKQTNPHLKFGDYLDALETEAKALDINT